ncbi:hypothetical protein [Mycobacterium sp. E740]|uniref:hypothetical protein n=1 Tax=Mycobacterium sp. E740 TaxID=1834149 RepID=UPI0007FFA95F|nr:hypothetical protein [Mycobacterium sp. E740]OBI81883.1 hypothetical protein A5663_15305 [Mycobacterium sp. E740]
MSTNTNRRFTRLLALPFVAAGIMAGALGLAGTAEAGTYTPDNTPRPGIVATPHTVAHPPQIIYRHGILHLQQVESDWHP